jgi:hypothetical protein
MTAMVHCDGCGFNVEPRDVREREESWDQNCSRCRKCTECPELREAYRRGFNAGLDALKEAVVSVVEKSNLRKGADDGG